MEIPNAEWLITTVNAPMTFNRGTSETWFLNPVRRYLFNAAHVRKFEENVESLSDIQGSPLYRPLNAARQMAGKRILVERFRDRGLGDLLFLTGPFAWLHYITGSDIKIHVYAFSDRGQVLQNCPHIDHGTVLVGPTHYADFAEYDAQWLINSVTESSAEQDQLNVYDALFTQIGVDPSTVDPRFKRPHVRIDTGELTALYQFFHTVWSERQFDLRKTGYYVLAPLTHSALRLAPYSYWIALAKELSRRRPVIVIGQQHEALPDSDISAGEFLTHMSEAGHQVINLVDRGLALRSVMALISQATALIGLDSGPLYIAQGCRVPAVSIWGPHDPGVRIGYDPDYMALAVWNQEFCQNSPCFAFGRFPIQKCPDGAGQKICQVLRAITVESVLEKVDLIEQRSFASVGVFRSKTIKKCQKDAKKIAGTTENSAP